MTNKRKYFGTDGIRGRVGVAPITPDFVLHLGWAAGTILSREKKRPKVIIGKDTRISGYMFESALEAGFSAAGVDILLLGPMPTPAIAFLTRSLHADAGVVISASHNPYYDNGIKFFGANGQKIDDALEEAIEAVLDQPLVMGDPEKLGRAKRIDDAPRRYIEFCKRTVNSDLTLDGLKIVIDCSHGATYHIAPDLFREMGAEVIDIAVDPDGININDNCGATNPQVMKRLVVAEGADLGIAFDGDGDRLMMVDDRGEIVDGDEILFILAKTWKAQGRLQGGVVGTVMSNFGLELAFQELGIDFVRSKVGDRYVLEEMLKRNWRLGGETSGHVICMDATGTGDGIIGALQILAVMRDQKKSLHELKAGMKKLPQVLINVKRTKVIDVNRDDAIQSAIKAGEMKLAGRGRILLRPSGTEPLIRVMVEGEQPKLTQSVAESIAEAVRNQM